MLRREKLTRDGSLSCVQMQFHYVNKLYLDYIWFKTIFFKKTRILSLKLCFKTLVTQIIKTVFLYQIKVNTCT